MKHKLSLSLIQFFFLLSANLAFVEYSTPVKSQAVAFNAVMPNSRLRILPKVGHMAHHFAAKEISDSISYIRNLS